MLITGRILIVIYVLLCIVAVLAFYTSDKAKEVTISEREYKMKSFLSMFLLCLLVTPIFYFIISKLKKK
jgi:uncharacterized membrane protein